MKEGRGRELRAVCKPVGAVLLGLGALTFITSVVGGIWEALSPLDVTHPEGAYALVGASVVIFVVGWLVYRLAPSETKRTLSRREALLSVSIIWVSSSVFAAVPLSVGAGLSPIDALFEAVSGFSTTGATVIPDAEHRLSRALHLYRSMLQWLGGVGIVVIFVAVFPSVGAGGKQLYKSEVSGSTKGQGIRPRIRETSLAIWKIYAVYTLMVACALAALGLSPFDAICHAFTAVSTAGFSTRDASIAAFDNPGVEYLLSLVMLISSASFGLIYMAFRKRSLAVLYKDVELRVFAGIVLLAWVALVLLNFARHEALEPAMRRSLFMVAATISSTGFGVEDYSSWAEPAIGLMLALMFVGGCAGSTAGGLKVERVIMLYQMIGRQVTKTFRPSSIQVVRVGRTIVADETLSAVAVVFVLFTVSIFGGACLVALLDGIPLGAAFGASLTCVANTGPSPFFLESDHFAGYSAASKGVFALLMILGRLEFLTVLALFAPSFWRR